MQSLQTWVKWPEHKPEIHKTGVICIARTLYCTHTDMLMGSSLPTYPVCSLLITTMPDLCFWRLLNHENVHSVPWIYLYASLPRHVLGLCWLKDGFVDRPMMADTDSGESGIAKTAVSSHCNKTCIANKLNALKWAATTQRSVVASYTGHSTWNTTGSFNGWLSPLAQLIPLGIQQGR